MTIDVNKLRELANEANEEKARQAERDRQELLRKEQVEREKAQAEANAIIIQVERIVEVAAREGKSHANIMKLEYKDYETRSGDISRFNLKLRATLVYDFLRDNGLSPSFEYDHDGVGINSWYMMQANW